MRTSDLGSTLCRQARTALAVAMTAAASAQAEASVDALIRAQTDAFSAASDRGDQTAMGALLDDEFLFSGGNGHVDRDEKKDRNDATSLLLEQQTQAFHDAAQRSDLATMRHYLDSQLVYVDEDGVLVGQREFKTGAPALPAWASSSTIAIKDWTLHYDGKVAVASYVDDQTARVGNQELHDQFLSVDTWIKRERAWKLLASYTIPLNQDPAPAHLAPQDLQQYVGVYSIDHGQTVKIASDGAALTRTGSDGKSASLSAVARDIFVITGTDAGYGRPLVVFKRDADGKVSGYVNRDLTIPKLDAQADSATGTPPAVHSTLVLRDFIAHSAGDVVVATFFHDRTTDFGTRSLHATYRSMETWVKRPDGWKMITSQGRELLPDAQTTSLAAAELGHYEGVYSAGANLAVKIALDGDALVASAPNSAPMRLLPVTRDYFIVRGSPRIGVLFVRDATGQITGYLSRRDGRDVSFTRT